MFQIVHSRNFSQIGRLVAKLWPFCTFCTIHTKDDVSQGLQKSNCQISATSRPIWLKIWLWTIWNILLWPYETNFCPISTPSMLSNFNGSEQKKGGVQWKFTFLAKVCYEVDLITKLFYQTYPQIRSIWCPIKLRSQIPAVGEIQPCPVQCYCPCTVHVFLKL